MRTETLCIEEIIHRPNDLRVSLDTPAQADALPRAKTELNFVDCSGLCEE